MNFYRCAAVAAAVAGAVFLGPPHVQASDDDSRFTKIADHYFAESFAANPVNATASGVHAYDARIGSYGARDMAAQLERDRRYLGRLDVLQSAVLSPDTALDRTLLANALHDDLLVNGTMAAWRHKPDTYVQIASGAIFSLISREFAPPAVRLSFAIARENAIPGLFAQARANLTGCDKETAELARDDALGTARFLEKDAVAAFSGAGDAATRAAFARSTRRAASAARAFARWLDAGFVAHPSGSYAIGAENYRARLRYEEAIDMPLDAYLAIGERALAQTHAQMTETARAIEPGATVERVVARVSKVHPTAARLIPEAQADLVRLRSFLIAHRIVDLPADANIKVTLTPPFERATSVASMDAPGPLETVATQAYYNVTPVDPHDSKAVQEAYLETFNDFERPIVSAHEVYPGHYTNYIVDKHLPLSLTKKLLGASSFTEGWAHYGEQMMVDEGWGDGDPRVRLMQLKEAILRNARYVAGVKMHTQGMTLAQAQAFFKREAFLDAADARIEARRGTQDATYGYYTLGKLEIFKLRRDYQAKLGSAYTLAKFHAALLAHGNPPIPLLRPLLLGDADDGKIL